MAADKIVFRNCRYKVADLSVAKEFYSKCFGVEPSFDEPTWIVFQIHDYQLWLEPYDSIGESVFEFTHSFDERSKHTMLTFWMVGDVQAVSQQFTDLGGSIYKRPTREGPFTKAIVTDPWSNKLGLHSILF